MKHLALRSFENRHANPVTSKSDQHVGPQRQAGLSSSFWILNANFVAKRRAVTSARWKKACLPDNSRNSAHDSNNHYALVDQIEGSMGLAFSPQLKAMYGKSRLRLG